MTIDVAKEYLSDERQRIRLHDLVAQETRRVIALTSEDNFPVDTSWSDDMFRERIDKYNAATSDLTDIQAALGYWGGEVHADIVALAPKRIAGRAMSSSGVPGWLGLRWYPVLLLVYAGGVAAVAAGRYLNLYAVLFAPPPNTGFHPNPANLAVALVRGLREVRDAFKLLPGHERHHVAQSEYLFKHLQPQLEDLLFLDSDYEASFDRFEALLALVHACYVPRWGPPGRFAWKFGRGDYSPMHELLREAADQTDAWPPIQAGLFSGSYDKFREVADSLIPRIANLGWS